MIRAGLIRWLKAPPVTGWSALMCAVGAVALPTAIRMAISGAVTGCEFTPYLPFVLLCAILLRWWKAAAVALASVAMLGGLLGGSPAVELPCFVPAAGIFLAASAMMIGFASLVRREIAAICGRRTDDPAGGIVFSLEKGEVWASWYGHGRPVRLGTQRKVAEMMEDFLAQVRLAKRLNGK
jgi:hypothetical protein